MDNNIVFKIKEGTGRLSGDGLCSTCAHSVVRIDRTGKSVKCGQHWYAEPIDIRDPVYHCNKYSNKSLPSLVMMEEIAWTLETPADKGKVGFAPPKRKE